MLRLGLSFAGDAVVDRYGLDATGECSAEVAPTPSRARGLALQGARATAVLTAGALLVGGITELAGSPVDARPRDYLLGIAATLIGVRVVAYARASPVGWLFLTVGLTSAITVVSGASAGTGLLAVAASWVSSWSWWLSYALLPVLLQALLAAVTGRRHAGLLVTALLGATLSTIGFAAAAWSAPAAFWATAESDGLQRHPVLVLVPVGIGLTMLSLLGSVVATVLRRRHLDCSARACGWLLAGGVLLAGATVLETVGYPVVWALGVATLPGAAVVAITRHGLYDIDLLVHRSLLYGALATILLAVYAGGALALGGLAPAQAAPAAAVAATLLAAPVHARLHRRVDRYVYGYRSAPVEVLSALTDSMGSADDSTSSVRSIAAAAATALRLPWAAIVLDDRSGHHYSSASDTSGAGEEASHRDRRIIDHGTSRGLPRESFPLNDRGERIGSLVVEVRSPEEHLTRGDREVLRLLAAQAGATVHAVQLSQDLQRSRERLVLAREEERRRLRRDLHDGLGPCLSGVRLQVAALRRSAAAPAAAPLEALAADLHRSAAELRTIVDDLRPPSLDRGLQAALELYAHRLSDTTLTVTVRCRGNLGELPAAVEVAAYRITTEALCNAARHAHATRCDVRVSRSSSALEICVDDDGVGPSAAPDADQPPRSSGSGIGLGSMRERAEELGGTMSITARSPAGTSVRVGLPAAVAASAATTARGVPSLVAGGAG